MADRSSRRWPALELTHPTTLDPIAEALLTVLDGLDVSGIEEQARDRWSVHFGSTAARDRAARLLADRFSPATVTVRPIDVPDEAWAERSQAALRAIQIGRLTIAPPWDVPEHTPADEIIVIEPSTGFGTGHHASTRLCLVALQELTLVGRSVLDLGTGSAVLALAAGRLGADVVTAVDVDPDAVAAARSNLARDPRGRAVRVILADIRELRDLRADIVVANVTGGFLVDASAQILALVEPSGQLVISGFTAEQASAVRAAFGDAVTVGARHEEEGWVALRLTARASGSEVAPDELQHGDRGQ